MSGASRVSPPKPDRLGTFLSTVDQAIRDATSDADFVQKIRVAEALE